MSDHDKDFEKKLAEHEAYQTYTSAMFNIEPEEKKEPLWVSIKTAVIYFLAFVGVITILEEAGIILPFWP